MKNKTEQIFTRVNEEEREQLNQLSEALDVPISQIVREGVRKHVKELLEKNAAEVETA